MVTINDSENLVPFIFMGCWNLDSKPRNDVTDDIRLNKIQTIVLGGDNVYHEKKEIGESLSSQIFKDRLHTLFDGINRLKGKKIYAALGNHDVDNNMIEVQLSLKEWIIPNRYYCVEFKDYSLIVIDTSINQSLMSEWLLEKVTELKNANKKYFYVQHRPFITFQHKVKNRVEKKILKLLYILSTYPPISILCAHRHNYQNATLNVNGVNIQQFIVGTGGAHQHSAIISKSYKFKNITYTLNEYIEAYGYLEVTLDNSKFIKIIQK